MSVSKINCMIPKTKCSLLDYKCWSQLLTRHPKSTLEGTLEVVEVPKIKITLRSSCQIGKKTKKRDTIDRNGVILHWYNYHVHTESLWDGLYMSHKPENHDQPKNNNNNNIRIIIMIAFMIHPCMTTFFSNPRDSKTVGHTAKYNKYTKIILAPPWIWLIYCYNLKPRQGFITESTFFLTVIIDTMIIFVQLCLYLTQHKQDHKLKEIQTRGSLLNYH